MIKRSLDIAASLAALAALSPFLAALALAVRLDSPGPALFRQTRVGRGGRDFTLYKFRTMRAEPGAEAGRFDCGDRRRVTRLGALLRRLKLDELPQLLNVLRGDMSLVGPRPEVRRWVEAYPERWSRVLTARPGLTDEASIEFRNEEEILAAAADPEALYRDVILPRKLDYAEAYAANFSLTGDISILARTLKALLSPPAKPARPSSAPEKKYENSLRRIAEAYAYRTEAQLELRINNASKKGALYIDRTQKRLWLQALRRMGFGESSLKQKKIYEIGCHGGARLAQLIAFGAAPENIGGCDILPEPLVLARNLLPAATRIKLADGADTGEPAGIYDLVFQNVAFSSILDTEHRRAAAREMWRLTAPGGWALSFDMRYPSPFNPDVRPVRPSELAEIFKEATESFGFSGLLAPPLARFLARGGFWLCDLLSLCSFLRSHYMAGWRKPSYIK